MIGRLQGILLDKGETNVLLDVQGVGYEVDVPTNLLYQLPELGHPLVLHTHFVVREDGQSLYGFPSLQERALFRLLIRVNGVGPKLALGILSVMDSSEFVARVMQNDASALVKLPGIGRKTAERLIIDLRDRFKEWQPAPGAVQPTATAAPRRDDHLQEAEAALVSLGYKPQEASRAVVHVASRLEEEGTIPATGELIHAALRYLGQAAG